MNKDIINCGQRKIQQNFRVAIGDICKAHGIQTGDMVEVYIKKVRSH